MTVRIAILTDYPPDLASFNGGVETAAAGLIEGLRDYSEEYSFHVVSTARRIPEDLHFKSNGINYHFLALARPWVRPRLPFRVARMIGELKRIRPDLVHCQGTTDAGLAAILGRFPRLFTIHGVRRHEANKRIGWERLSSQVDAIIEPFVLRNFQTFICISNYAKLIAGDEKQTYLIPNAVRSPFFNVQRKSGESPLRSLYLGALSPLKRPTDLMEAHRELRQWFPSLETVLCGAPESQSYMRYLYAQSSEGIIFRGHLDQEGLINELCEATVLVLPSSQENFPMVIGEAMAAGVPVVATTVGGIADMLENGRTGFLYEAGDVGTLTMTLKGLLSDCQLRMKLTEAAKSEAHNRFHPIKVGGQTLNVYRRMLSNGQE